MKEREEIEMQVREKIGKRPEHALTVRTYDEFCDDVSKFADGKYNALLVIGDSGIAKGRTCENTIGADDCATVSGKPSAWGFYQWCFDNMDKFLILDDIAPTFYRDADANAMMKNLLETRKEKTLHWKTGAAGEGKDYPREFTTTSKVIILVNDWESTSEHIRAIEGRAQVMMFQPSFMELHQKVSEWFPKKHQDVFDYIYEHRRLCVKPNMRLYTKTAEQKEAGSPWRKRCLEMMIGDERMQQIASLLMDEKYQNNTQRCKQFEKLGYGKSSTFYKLLAEFKNLVPSADERVIKLTKE